MERNKTVLITGATSGIGLAFAKLFAKEKYELVLVARNQTHLEQTAQDLQKQYHVFVKVIAADLSHKTAAQEVFGILQRDNVDIEVLINNAGIATNGEFAKQSWEDHQGLLTVDITTLTHLTYLVLPHMLAKKHGKILFVASTAAFLPGPLMSLYYASKAYVYSFAQSLVNELRGSGVSVTCLCPGPTQTNFVKSANMQSTRLFSGPFTMKPDVVAKAGFDGLVKGKPLVIPGITNKVMVFGMRFLPVQLLASLSRYMEERRVQ